MSEKQLINAMGIDELANYLDDWYSSDAPRKAAVMLRQQHNKIENLQENNARLDAELDTANKAYMWMDETYKGVLAEIEALKDQLDGCTCQGGHSEAWLRAKGRLK